MSEKAINPSGGHHEMRPYRDPTSLSNLDLLTVLVGDAASTVMAVFPTLDQLDTASQHELSQVPGLDDVAVSRLLAVRALARRRAEEQTRRGTPILDARTAVEILEPLLRDETREIVIVLALDTKRRMLCLPITVAIGTIDSVPCHPREIFRPLIRVSASAAILVHLHPSSGEPVPSPEDVMLTSRLKEAGELLGLPLLDHIVIGRGCYVSMLDRGLM